MNLRVKHDPKTYRVTVNIGELGLPKQARGALYRALIEISNKEPDLLASITFDGAVLELISHTDNAEKVLSALHQHSKGQKLGGELAEALRAELQKVRRVNGSVRMVEGGKSRAA